MSGTRIRPWLNLSKALAVVTASLVVLLFVTAGGLVQSGEARVAHGAAAIALHVVTAVWAIALAGLARVRRQGWWAPVMALALFAFSFVQAGLGKGYTVYLHVPGSLAIVIGTAVLATWLFVRRLLPTEPARG